MCVNTTNELSFLICTAILSGDEYSGSYEKGKRSGQGVYRFANGSVYSGEFKDNLKSGRGQYHYHSGATYDGEWANGDMEGFGTYTFPSGDKYEGNYKAGKMHGTGTYTYATGQVVTGEFIDGKAPLGSPSNPRPTDDMFRMQKQENTDEMEQDVDYTGDIDSRGLKHGKGRIVYSNGDVYEGEWKDNVKSGTGVYLFKDSGDQYSGQWKQGKFHGTGAYSYKIGHRYEGGFERGVRSGKGDFKWKNGSVYKGFWRNDLFDGTGEYIAKDKVPYYYGQWSLGFMHGKHAKYQWGNMDIYTGDFDMGKPHGKGKITYMPPTADFGVEGSEVLECEFSEGQPVGSKAAGKVVQPIAPIEDLPRTKDTEPLNDFGYIGEINEKGEKEGEGVMRYKNKDFYSGTWKRNLKHGFGVYRYNNGDVYIGEFRKGKRSGKGLYKYSSGDTFEGSYVGGKRDGPGLYRYADGSSYLGSFENDEMHGKGLYKYPDGSVYNGDWALGRAQGVGTFRHADGHVYEVRTCLLLINITIATCFHHHLSPLSDAASLRVNSSLARSTAAAHFKVKMARQ